MPLVEKNRGYEFPCEISMNGEKDDTEHVDTIYMQVFLYHGDGGARPFVPIHRV
jgi:hypothetical protein